MSLRDFIFPRDKSAWDKMQDQSKLDSTRYRDVHGTQQIERGKLQKKIKPTSRIILAAIAGLIVAIAVWFLFSGLSASFSNFGNKSTVKQIDQKLAVIDAAEKGGVLDDDPYSFLDIKGNRHTYIMQTQSTKTSSVVYKQTNERGLIASRAAEYSSKAEVPVPAWYTEWKARSIKEIQDDVKNNNYDKEKLKANKERLEKEGNFGEEISNLTLLKLMATLGSGLLTFFALYAVFMKNLSAQNLLADTSDINQYENDQHIQLPEEVHRNYDWFPDVGAHSAVSVSSMISHTALSNKGIKKIDLARRHKKDSVDEDGEVIYKGDYVVDENGDIEFDRVEFFDKKFATELFEASFVDDSVDSLREWYDATKIPYNPGNKNRDKLKGYDTVADLINNEWEFPYYEPQRPAGAYIVDTAPVNTMV